MTMSESVFVTAHRLQQAGTPYALVSVVKALPPASARPGDKAVVTGDGTLSGWVGGGCALPAVVRTVREALRDGRARLIRIAPATAGQDSPLDDVLEFGMSCHSGGTLELFVDPVLPRARMVVIGSSPVALSLTELAPRLGFAVTLVAHGAAPAVYDDDVHVIASDEIDDIAGTIEAHAWIVVATQGRRDLQGLRLALALKPCQISFVASSKKAQVLKDALIASGQDPESVRAIVAPAGYPMPATTPEEIALSVLAAVVAQRRGAKFPAPSSEDRPATAHRNANPATASTCCGQSQEAGTGEAAQSVPDAAAPNSSCCAD